MAWAMLSSVIWAQPGGRILPSSFLLIAERRQEFATLLQKLRRGLGEHPFEDLVRSQRRHRLRLFHRGLDGGALFGLDLLLPGFVPPALADEVPSDPLDRVPLAPLGDLLLRPVAARIV